MSDKIDVFFNFDTPYTGDIKLKKDRDKIKIILKNAVSQEGWLKKIDSSFIYQIALQPKDSDSELIVYTIDKTAVLAAKSNDGYGLKLTLKRLKQINQPAEKKSGSSNFFNILLYIIGSIVIVALFIFIFFIFSAKKPKIKKKSINIESEKEKEINVKFEKPLDEHNKIALIAYKDVNYLVIIGSTNILLGKYKEGEINSQEDFEKLISSTQVNNEDISLKNDKKDEILNELEEYKEKVSKEI